MKVINLRNNAALADKAKIADNFFKRLIGLLNRNSLQEGEGLILRPSNSIHTCFMRFAIDALFLDKNNQVIAVLPALKPFRLSPIYFNALLTIELPVGVIEKSLTKIGDTISMVE